MKKSPREQIKDILVSNDTNTDRIDALLALMVDYAHEQTEELTRWKADAIVLFDKINAYAENTKIPMRLGASVIDETIRRAKVYDDNMVN